MHCSAGDSPPSAAANDQLSWRHVCEHLWTVWLSIQIPALVDHGTRGGRLRCDEPRMSHGLSRNCASRRLYLVPLWSKPYFSCFWRKSSWNAVWPRSAHPPSPDTGRCTTPSQRFPSSPTSSFASPPTLTLSRSSRSCFHMALIKRTTEDNCGSSQPIRNVLL